MFYGKNERFTECNQIQLLLYYSTSLTATAQCTEACVVENSTRPFKKQ